VGVKAKKDKSQRGSKLRKGPSKLMINGVTEPGPQPTILTEEWQKATAEKARNRG